MAAAAYKVTMTVKTKQGIKSFFLTASDINTAAWVFSSGATEIPLDSEDATIIDIINGTPTDTSNVTVYAGGIDTGLRIVNSSNLATTYFRQIMQSPIGIKGGVPVKFVQNT